MSLQFIFWIHNFKWIRKHLECQQIWCIMRALLLMCRQLTAFLLYPYMVKRKTISAIWLFVQCSVVSDSLWPHAPQHTRLSCPSLSTRVCSNSCPLSRWCHQTILSSVALFSSCLQSFLASGSFPSSFHQGAKTWSFSFSINPSNEYSGLISFKIDWFDLLAVQGDFKSLLQHYN